MKQLDFHKSSIRSRPSRLEEGLGAVEIFFWWRQILASVKAVHDKDIIHCDLKPQNFILFRQRRRTDPEELGTDVLFEHEKYMLKLSDFGVSRELQNSATHVSENLPIGTVRYMAPEVLHDCRSNGHLWVGKAADNWSIGVLLHEMLHKGLTPHSHVERRKHKFRLMLAIADEKSARVRSSCPRLLHPSRTNKSAVRLASTRHAALIDLQSVCLQFLPKERASTQHLVSFTEEKERLFFGLDEHQLPSDDSTDGTAEDIVGDSEHEVLVVDWNDVAIDHAADVVIDHAQAGEEPRAFPDERSVVHHHLRAPDEETWARGLIMAVLKDGGRGVGNLERYEHQAASGGNEGASGGRTAGGNGGGSGAGGASGGNGASTSCCDAGRAVESSSLSRPAAAEAGENSPLIVDLEAGDNSSVERRVRSSVCWRERELNRGSTTKKIGPFGCSVGFLIAGVIVGAIVGAVIVLRIAISDAFMPRDLPPPSTVPPSAVPEELVPTDPMNPASAVDIQPSAVVIHPPKSSPLQQTTPLSPSPVSPSPVSPSPVSPSPVSPSPVSTGIPVPVRSDPVEDETLVTNPPVKVSPKSSCSSPVQQTTPRSPPVVPVRSGPVELCLVDLVPVPVQSGSAGLGSSSSWAAAAAAQRNPNEANEGASPLSPLGVPSPGIGSVDGAGAPTSAVSGRSPPEPSPPTTPPRRSRSLAWSDEDSCSLVTVPGARIKDKCPGSFCGCSQVSTRAPTFSTPYSSPVRGVCSSSSSVASPWTRRSPEPRVRSSLGTDSPLLSPRLRTQPEPWAGPNPMLPSFELPPAAGGPGRLDASGPSSILNNELGRPMIREGQMYAPPPPPWDRRFTDNWARRFTDHWADDGLPGVCSSSSSVVGQKEPGAADASGPSLDSLSRDELGRLKDEKMYAPPTSPRDLPEELVFRLRGLSSITSGSAGTEDAPQEVPLQPVQPPLRQPMSPAGHDCHPHADQDHPGSDTELQGRIVPPALATFSERCGRPPPPPGRPPPPPPPAILKGSAEEVQLPPAAAAEPRRISDRSSSSSAKPRSAKEFVPVVDALNNEHPTSAAFEEGGGSDQCEEGGRADAAYQDGGVPGFPGFPRSSGNLSHCSQELEPEAFLARTPSPCLRQTRRLRSATLPQPLFPHPVADRLSATNLQFHNERQQVMDPQQYCHQVLAKSMSVGAGAGGRAVDNTTPTAGQDDEDLDHSKEEASGGVATQKFSPGSRRWQARRWTAPERFCHKDLSPRASAARELFPCSPNERFRGRPRSAPLDQPR